jgi:hypothetical protein
MDTKKKDSRRTFGGVAPELALHVWLVWHESGFGAVEASCQRRRLL